MGRYHQKKNIDEYIKMASPVLFLLFDVLGKEKISIGIEIIAFNGENNHSAERWII